MLLHGGKKPLLPFPDAEMGEKLLPGGSDRGLTPAVKIQQIPVMKKPCGNLHVKDPLIINAVNMAAGDHQILEQSVHVGGGGEPSQLSSPLRNRPEYLCKVLAGNKGTALRFFYGKMPVVRRKILREHQRHDLLQLLIGDPAHMDPVRQGVCQCLSLQIPKADGLSPVLKLRLQKTDPGILLPDHLVLFPE